MRITKKWLREVRTSICAGLERINDLDDLALRKAVDSVVSDVPTDATRSQLLTLLAKNRVYASIPDEVCD